MAAIKYKVKLTESALDAFPQLRQAVASGSCVRKATEVPLLLLPLQFHPFGRSPCSKLTKGLGTVR